MAGADAVRRGLLTYVEPLSNGTHVVCECRSLMHAEQGRQVDEEVGQNAWWLWYRCAANPEHVTRAIPLPVQMARG